MKFFPFGTAPKAAELGYATQETARGTEEQIAQQFKGDLIAVAGWPINGDKTMLEWAIMAPAKVRNLICCCCGSRTKGRQWFNQDTGWGLGKCCADYCETRVDNMLNTYGKRGVHYDIPDADC